MAAGTGHTAALGRVLDGAEPLDAGHPPTSSRPPVETRTSEPGRVAWHEAGHAVAYVLLGVPLEYASIAPGERFAGVNVPAATDSKPTDFDPGRLAGDQPVTRAIVEKAIVIDFAGSLAERFYSPPRSGYYEDPTPEQAAAALRRLPPRVAELAAVKAANTEHGLTDEEQAQGLAATFVGEASGWAYVAWLRQEAEWLVIQCGPAIRRVAGALQERVYLTGDEIAAIVHERSTDA